MSQLPALKRRRGAIKASITKLATKVAELEDKEPNPTIVTHAQQLSKRLENLDSDYKTRHFAILDVIEDEGQLTTGQETLDQHDDDIADLSLRIQTVMDLARSTTPTLAPSTPAVDTHSLPNRSILERRSTQFQARLISINEKIDDFKDDGSEIHLISLYQEYLADLKKELSELRNEILAITVDTSDPLMSNTQKQEDNIFGMAVKVKKLLFSSSSSKEHSTSTKATPETHSVKLPKIDIPTFDGEMLHWQTFWEQFGIAVDEQPHISDTEKLVYLRHSLKDGSAKHVIEGLSHSGNQYKEAIDSLKARYDRPRIVHQTHVRKIYDVPSLKDGSGKELRRFHDTVQQHLRALKAMDKEPTGSFITALLELKLDKDTMFEWQKASQDSKKTPHYDDLLKFLDLHAQASETCSSEPRRYYHQIYGNHFPNQQPPLWRIHNRQMHLIVRYVRLRSIPCMLVRSSSCSLTTRCCPLSAQAMYVLIVSNQVTSQRIAEATIVAGNARSHITRCFTVSLQKTKNSQSLPLPNLLL